MANFLGYLAPIETLGVVVATEQTLTPPAWVPSTTVPTPQIVQTSLAPTLIGPTSTVPTTAVVAGPLIAPFIAATTSVPTPTIARFSDFQIIPDTGLTTGGEPLTLLGSALDMSACTPDLSDGTLDPGFWTDLSTNSGEVLEVPATRSLRLNTGLTPNSIAGLRTVEFASDVDIAVRASVLIADPVIQSPFELALFVSADTDFRILVQGDLIVLRVRENGQTLFEQPIATTAGNPQVRLLRVAENVLVFLGGAIITQASWVTTNCQIEFIAQNNATAESQAATQITQYVRRPVVVFDETPLTGIEVVGDRQALAETPARKLPGPIDVRVTGCDTLSDTLTNAFTYILDPALPSVFHIPTGARLTAISDPVVTGRIGRST